MPTASFGVLVKSYLSVPVVASGVWANDSKKKQEEVTLEITPLTYNLEVDVAAKNPDYV